MVEELKEQKNCPHCGAPIDAGHAPDCPTAANEASTPAKRFELSQDPEIKGRLKELRTAFNAFHEQRPEAIALGLYGSTVKGRAGAGSDIDFHLFIDADELLRKNPDSRIEGGEAHAKSESVSWFRLDDQTHDEYADAFRKVASQTTNLTEQQLEHPSTALISRGIIDYQVQEMEDYVTQGEAYIQAKRKYDEYLAHGGSQENAPKVPEPPARKRPGENIVCMFYLQIGHGLDKYRTYLLDKLDQLDYKGEIIWRGMVRSLEFYEREAVGTNIPYPRILEEAKKMYSK